MAEDTDTPVEVPHVRVVRAGSAGNGVPEHVEFETTDQVVEAVMAGGVSEDLMASFAEKAIASFVANGGGGGGGGGDGAAATLKEIKKHKWLAGLLSLFLGSGGMVGSYYALKSRAEHNTHEVQGLKEAAKTTEASSKHNTDEIRFIKVDISDINTSVDGMKTQQTAIVSGIEELKQENVDRLEKENAKLEREIRRLERNR